MKSPAFRFYASDFVTGTDHMSSCEVGLYIRLLCYSWLTGGLPDDDDRLVRLGRWDGKEFPDAVRKKFSKCDDGLLRNVRLEEEREKQEKHSLQQKANILKRWSVSTVSNSHVEQNTSQSPKLSTPTLDEVKLLVAKSGMPDIEAEKFFNHYESNGWKVGRNRMKSVAHAVANWKLNGHQFTKHQPKDSKLWDSQI